MAPKGTDLIIFTNTSPLFKGIAVILVGILALIYIWWLIKKWKEPITWQFVIFISLSVFIVLYGLFILVLQPHWWNPPWWPVK